jgi:hypothetical protein
MTHWEETLGLPSASDMYALSQCHGKMILTRSLVQKGMIDLSVKSVYADLGMRIHASLEGEPETLERKANDVRDSCDRLAHEAARQFGMLKGKEDEIFYEQRLWYRIGDQSFFSAKPDRVYRSGQRALDVNFKTGRGDEEESSRNTQLRTEGVCIKSNYPEIEEIGSAIIQPLVTHQPEIAVYDAEALKEAEIEILEIVDATHWDAGRKAGEWCKYCPCRPFCPEAKQLALAYPLTINLDALPLGQDGARTLEKVNTAYGILDAIWEAYAEIVKKDSAAIDGWWINNGRQLRTIKDWREIRETVANLSPESFDVEALLSLPIGKLEEACAKEWGLSGKLLERRFEDTFGHAIEFKQTKGSLAKMPKKMLKNRE